MAARQARPSRPPSSGCKSARFGALTFGRQVTLLSEGTIKYDPNYNATAFGLLGASNTYSGGGSSEDNRLDSTAKYAVSFNDLVHLGALYKFNGSNGSANTASRRISAVSSRAHRSMRITRRSTAPSPPAP